MGEAKVLVEVELDKPFPKLIALDDKQGNIYVEYTWIPSNCERCGALGHKEKRCLLPSKPQDSAPAKVHVPNEEVPLVEIDKLLQNSSETLAALHKITTNSSFNARLEVLASTTFTHSHEVISTSCLKFENTLPMLAVENAAHPHSHKLISHHSPITHNHKQFNMEREILPTHGKIDGFDEVVETSGLVLLELDISLYIRHFLSNSPMWDLLCYLTFSPSN
ncbi:hypothetical protein Bca52824_076752 [Brassica carinata]|uniref:CCHC-type domain-containing protein n=1 Tax=Brassica carinata TaxID=52824 RepID=A0A8X7PUK9_BRACI|nr:hypothetical protein Bca52824_076752 [Brassica carinata]